MTASVLVVWCTTTLSMITCVPSGVARAMSWMKRDAESTSRQTALWRSSSAQNQRKPKRVAAGARHHKPAAIFVHELVAAEYVAPGPGEVDVAELAPHVVEKLANFAAKQAGDDDALRLQLAAHFANDLRADHAGPAEDEDRYGRGDRYDR